MAPKDTEKTGFTAEERKAMMARSRELAREKKAAKKREAGEQALLEAIAEMTDADKALAERIHQLVTEAAPDLWPKTWYGMPAYAQDGTVICFFQAAGKFNSRYATFGFNDAARIDDGVMWPTSFAVTELTPQGEELITKLVRKAAGSTFS
ncbi:iron chaperone [Spirochaeta lutea]|uniref:Uncharacterized protein n=1 Tax=Spirochaeta lutea TaxID=1480694 RepID=A0A098R1D9_9SPIO|nr:DUF1801 domain-containing protein [Spirochaeta lutea]KGE73493.1 hypothetical protein DC28_03345 [Spirochaeta lutea]